MARYIDADKLLEELQEEIDFETLMYTEEQNKFFNCGLKCAYRDVEHQPAADVAPKSEVDEIMGKYDDLKLKYVDLQKDKAELIVWANDKKSEVAREIFAEIERVVGYALCVDLTDWSDYTELKKKYTEEKE